MYWRATSLCLHRLPPSVCRALYETLSGWTPLGAPPADLAPGGSWPQRRAELARAQQAALGRMREAGERQQALQQWKTEEALLEARDWRIRERERGGGHCLCLDCVGNLPGAALVTQVAAALGMAALLQAKIEDEDFV